MDKSWWVFGVGGGYGSRIPRRGGVLPSIQQVLKLAYVIIIQVLKKMNNL